MPDAEPRLSFQTISERVDKNLFPRNALRQYNENLLKIHPQENTERVLEKYSVYELDVLLKLDNTKLLLEHEREFVKSLQETDDVKGVIRDYVQKSLDYFRSSVKSEESLKLLRTALLIYKNYIVSRPLGMNGGFKEALGPIGLSTKDQYLDDLLHQIGPLSRWDGDISKIEAKRADQTVNTESFIRLRPKDENPKNQEDLNEEVKLIEAINKKLNHPKFLPKIKQKGNNSVYMEYIPLDFMPSKTKTFSSDFLALTDSVERSWKEAGVIYADLKPNNLRKRNNGDVVIIDWGCHVITTPEETTFSPKDISAGIINYAPPEVVRAIFNHEGGEISIEKYLVFSIGITMLLSMYFKENVDNALQREKGRRIDNEVKSNMLEKEVPNFSISPETLDELKRRLPVPIGERLYLEVKQMLDDDPQNRPTLSEVKIFLASINNPDPPGNS